MNAATEQQTVTRIVLRYRRNSFGEYCVKVYEGVKASQMKSYFTDDWQDAVQTADAMAKEYGIAAEVD